MSWVSEIKEICGDYYIDIKYYKNQKEAISLFFNSYRNAETVKRCIELDDSIPNAATAVDFVEVVRCKDCRRFVDNKEAYVSYCTRELKNLNVKPNDFCSYGEKALKERESE